MTDIEKADAALSAIQGNNNNNTPSNTSETAKETNVTENNTTEINEKNAPLSAAKTSAETTEGALPGYSPPRPSSPYQNPNLNRSSKSSGPNSSRNGRLHRLLTQYRPLVHLAIFAVMTGWWIAGLVLHRHDMNWVVPFLVWLAVSARLVFWHVPAKHISHAISLTWTHTAVRIHSLIPPRLRTPAGAFITISVMVVGSLVPGESADNTRANRAVSLFGLVVFVVGLWATSRNRRKVNWRPVIGGMLMQYLIALFVLRTAVGYKIFKFIADRAGDLLGYARDGVAFLTTPDVAALKWFLIGVVPAIIFFISLVQLLYHVGFLQWFVAKVAVFVFWALNVSGAEAVVAAATPFIGQGESAMLVRPFVPHMTDAEMHQILTCGFATISGAVLVGYIGLGLDAEVLVSSCIMSIPASLAISKLRYPETEETLTAGRVTIPEDNNEGTPPANALQAFASGTWLGIRIGGTIIASLLCVMAAVGLVNGLLGWWGRYLNISNLSLQLLGSYVCYPLAFLLGVPRNNGDLYRVARLISEKIVTNEYRAFELLTTDPWYVDHMSARARLIATYACAGFGNIASLGVQVGILSQLAPARAGDVSRLAVSALVSGVLATLTSATVAGLVVV